MSTSPSVSRHAVVPGGSNHIITIPLCPYHVDRVEDDPYQLLRADVSEDQLTEIRIAADCNLISWMYESSEEECSICKGFKHENGTTNKVC